jgi:hypothetical protein
VLFALDKGEGWSTLRYTQRQRESFLRFARALANSDMTERAFDLIGIGHMDTAR